MQVITENGILEEVKHDKDLERIINLQELWWQFKTTTIDIKDIQELLSVMSKGSDSDFAKNIVINNIKEMLYLNTYTEEEILPILDNSRKEAFELMKRLENEIN